MVEFSYTNVPGKIPSLLKKMREVGVPSKVSVLWLKSVGFTSSNDNSLLAVLKFIGFTDGSGSPTSAWRNYRGAKHKEVLANAIRSSYSELFDLYDDAYRRPIGELTSFFSTRSSAGQQVISRTVATFKALAEEADFSLLTGQQSDDPDVSAVKLAKLGEKTPDDIHRQHREAPSLHIDVQIHISPESSPEQIEHIFASMTKHLYGVGRSN